VLQSDSKGDLLSPVPKSMSQRIGDGMVVPLRTFEREDMPGRVIGITLHAY
jgi:hypothetical protein